MVSPVLLLYDISAPAIDNNNTTEVIRSKDIIVST